MIVPSRRDDCLNMLSESHKDLMDFKNSLLQQQCAPFFDDSRAFGTRCFDS